MSRIISLIDMDCFYAQVEQRIRPELYGQPVGVCQLGTNVYNQGMILAVSYEAKAMGVKRGMSANEARQVCPAINLCSIPPLANIHKADLSRYRSASGEVFNVLENFPNIVVEKASVDEAYIDLTDAVDRELVDKSTDAVANELMTSSAEIFPTTYLADGDDIHLDASSTSADESKQYDRLSALVSWIDGDCRKDILHLRLAVGAKIIEQIRKRIMEETKFHCSAGIAYSKVIAKLICSRHKPKQQTAIPPKYIPKVYESIPINSVRNLGGKLGYALMTHFGIKTMGELANVSADSIISAFPDSASWILKIARGEDDEPIREGIKPKSIAVSKNFTGKFALTTVNAIEQWGAGLVKELCARLNDDQVKYQRTAHNIVVGFYTSERVHYGRTFRLTSYNPDCIQVILFNFMKPYNKGKEGIWSPSVTHIGVSASKFKNGVNQRVKQITSWFDSFTSNPEESLIEEKDAYSSPDEDEITILDMKDESIEFLEVITEEDAHGIKDVDLKENAKDDSDILIVYSDAIPENAFTKMTTSKQLPSVKDEKKDAKKKLGRQTSATSKKGTTKGKKELKRCNSSNISKFFSRA